LVILDRLHCLRLTDFVFQGEPSELLKKAFHANDAKLVRKLLERYPEFKARINGPIGPFDSTPVAFA